MKVVVKRETTAQECRVQVGNKEVDFDASGKGTVVAGAGVHTLTYQVIGHPGDTYSIEIVSPPDTGSTEGTLDESEHDEGDFDFTI